MYTFIEQAMKDWTKHTTLLSVPDAPSVPAKVKSGPSDARSACFISIGHYDRYRY